MVVNKLQWLQVYRKFLILSSCRIPHPSSHNVTHYEPLFFRNTFMNKINSHLFDCSVKSCKNKSSDSDFIFIQIHNAHKKREDLYLSSLDKWKDVSLEFIFTNDVLNLQDRLWWSQHLQFPRPPFFLWQFLTVDDPRGASVGQSEASIEAPDQWEVEFIPGLMIILVSSGDCTYPVSQDIAVPHGKIKKGRITFKNFVY